MISGIEIVFASDSSFPAIDFLQIPHTLYINTLHAKAIVNNEIDHINTSL